MSDAELLRTYDPWVLPSVGPLTWPAVFALRNDDVLVWGRGRWGWVRCASSCRVRSVDDDLEQTVERMEREVRERTNAEGYTLHHGSVVTLSAEPLSSSVDGQASARHLPRSIEVFTASVVPAWAAERSALPDRLELTGDSASSWPVVARIATRGRSPVAERSAGRFTAGARGPEERSLGVGVGAESGLGSELRRAQRRFGETSLVTFDFGTAPGARCKGSHRWRDAALRAPLTSSGTTVRGEAFEGGLPMQLKVYDVAPRTIEMVGPMANRIAGEDRDLARQLRAATSVVLNLSEGERQRGGNRRARFETAIGSASESVACLDCAMALGYVEKSDAILAAQDGFGRVGRTLTKLMRAGR